VTDHERPELGLLLRKVDDVTGALEHLAEALNREEDLSVLLQRMCRHVLQVIPGAEMASVSLLHDGRAETVATTDDRAVDIDRAQYRTQEGPCLEAAKTGKVVRVTVADALDTWPAFVEAASRVAVASYLSAPLFIDREYHGSLNLYGGEPHGFGEVDEALLELYTTAAETALRTARRYFEARELADRLRQALTSRAVIDQAKGIIMAARGLTADDAFALLVDQSQKQNIKVRDLAQQLVTGVLRNPD
jgi:GAF domain-containing protein